MTDMHNEIKRKEEIIEQLRQCLEMTQHRERERDAPNGLVKKYSFLTLSRFPVKQYQSALSCTSHIRACAEMPGDKCYPIISEGV